MNKKEEQDAIDDTKHEEPSVTNNPFINEPSYFNIFKCGKTLLNRLDATCEQACITTARYRYSTEMYKTLTDYNDRNNEPLLNDNIREAISKVIEEESISDTNNVTVDTFSHTSNTQRQNANTIFTSENLGTSEYLEYA